ncbi:sugar ABC transporter ATP-binding protein [Kribbella sp. CA-253562]|uniref:sugar ABC transporter ATP-binding protein n=1 Tax=Kribbella sp. CA-253562 TaxID=3239942 RepID=UPI003D8A0EE6
MSSGVHVQELSKSYGPNQVLRAVSVTFEAGRVHALLGANGAGKSTLLGCLSGATQPDAGEIKVGDQVHRGFAPRDAFDAGIAIIYQHFQLIGPLTVADNIFLGQELRTRIGTVDRRRQNDEARRVLDQLGISMDPTVVVDRLSVGQQQMVEIARAIRRRPSVLILDEPTAALGAHEVEALTRLVRHLAHNQGLSVVYVTHLLTEVLDVADDITVLRDGRVLWTRVRDEVDLAELVGAISPEASDRSHRRPRPDRRTGREVLRLTGFHAGYTGPVDLVVAAGETVGVFGLLGSGRTNLLEALAGVGPQAGTVELDDRRVTLGSPGRAQRAGISLVASNREAQSLFRNLSAIENLLMPHYSRLSRGGRRFGRERAAFARAADNVGLTPREPSTAAGAFSGGNAQKIAVARWASVGERVRCLLLDEPTQGVDVGARQDLYELVRQFAIEQEAAVIFASSDPEEVIALADTVAVLVEGRLVRVTAADQLTEFDLTHLAQPELTEESAPT